MVLWTARLFNVLPSSRAMGGGVPFEQALAARLSIIKPSVKDVDSYLAAHPPR